MADTCIVCLGDLLSTKSTVAIKDSSKSIHADEETIAHLLPCKHDLHNACLKPWVERANSCPICRATFNMVELSQCIGGAVVDSYAVRDKVQEAELDPSMIIEDELFAVEAWESCIVCGVNDDTQDLMYCDGCDKPVHVFCTGHTEAPDMWYCETCDADLEVQTELRGIGSAVRRQPLRRAPAATTAAPRSRYRNNDAIWARVWQEVSRQVDLDLDFPFDDEATTQRTPQERREFAQWQRRLQVADDTGTRSRLRDIAAARLYPSHAVAQPESQEELRAWNAFDKARESTEAPATIRRRKRKATASPASPHEQEIAQPSQLKRPRLRRPPMTMEQQAAESSHAALQRNDERSTFLSLLLKDVETNPVAAGSPGASDQYNAQHSPLNSSPVGSPTSSGHGTPRALSPTPPPQRPMSPPLSSMVSPISSPDRATFSPFSPTGVPHDRGHVNSFHHRGRRRGSSDSHEDEHSPVPRDRASPTSPNRNLSYSTKQEIQRMVKLALGPRYKDKEINKDQYTDINRDVSRRMYDMVGDASALTDHAERERWQGVAEEEVRDAIATLHFGASA